MNDGVIPNEETAAHAELRRLESAFGLPPG